MVQNGQAAAFAALVERYQDRIFSVTCRMVGYEDATDLTQEIFLKAYRSIGSFRLESQFSTWIYRIMLNTVNSHRRKTQKERKVFLVSDVRQSDDEQGCNTEPVASDPLPQDILLKREQILAVQDAIAELDEIDRSIILLREMDERSYDEIAAILDVPLGTVKSRLYRARAALKERLAGYLRVSRAEPEN